MDGVGSVVLRDRRNGVCVGSLLRGREQGLGLVQMFLGRVGRRLLERLAGAQWCKTDCAS